jgi:hypothetical protein
MYVKYKILDAGLNECGIKIKNPKSKIQNAITGC